MKRFERLRRSRLLKGLTGAGRGVFTALAGRGPRTGRRTAEPVVRPASEADAPFIEALSRCVFSPYGPYGEILAQWFEHRLGITLVAFVGGTRAGFVMIGPLDANGRLHPVAEILAIAVEPRFQGGGTGRMLLSEALAEARALGAQSVVLHTAEENVPALRLFESFGFVPLALKKGFYPEGQNAHLMARAIGG